MYFVSLSFVCLKLSIYYLAAAFDGCGLVEILLHQKFAGWLPIINALIALYFKIEINIFILLFTYLYIGPHNFQLIIHILHLKTVCF